MKSTTIPSFYSTLAVVLFSLVDPASAQDTESFSYTTPSAQFPFTDSFTLPSFNTDLGTLQAVDLTVQADTTADVKVYNALSSAQTFTNAKASIATTVTDPAGTIISVIDEAALANGTAAPGLNDFPGIPSTGADSVQISPSNFNVWEGNQGQTVILNLTVEDGTFSGSAAPGVFLGGIAVVDVSTTVTYTYAPRQISAVPEPSTWALLLGGLLILVATRLSGIEGVLAAKGNQYPNEHRH